MMEKLSFRIIGVVDLLMHNGQLADPLNEHTRALADAIKKAKKAKTDAAWGIAYKAEFMGGLYLDEKLEPCIPGEVIEAMIIEGARKSKQGKETTASVIVDGNFPLEYKGPRNPEKLWEAGMKFFKRHPVRVGQNRVIRTRPKFPAWSCKFEAHYNPALINKKDMLKFIEVAGEEVGIGDGRPRYGRFTVEAADGRR